LEDVFSQSDVVFVVASVTSDNLHFIDKTWFARMQKGAHFILLSRADVVNFDDLIAAVRAGAYSSCERCVSPRTLGTRPSCARLEGVYSLGP
jgi:phosphoglycerate dehydrogenase-like enzyme